MKQKSPPLADRLLAKLVKLGLPERRAKVFTKGLVPMVQRTKVTGTVTGKLTDRLVKLGLSELKAGEYAKGLAPLVRSTIKAKAKAKAIKLDAVTDEMVDQTVTEVTDSTDNEELDKVAPRVNGHRVRLDLPVVQRTAWMTSPTKGIELLRVMDGLTSNATYLVAAVKKDVGIVAVRQLGQDWYNVKFYPTMAYWNVEQNQLQEMGTRRDTYLSREYYERMHFTREGLTVLLTHVEQESKPKITRLLSRLLSVTGASLIKAFDYLHKRRSVAA